MLFFSPSPQILFPFVSFCRYVCWATIFVKRLSHRFFFLGSGTSSCFFFFFGYGNLDTNFYIYFLIFGMTSECKVRACICRCVLQRSPRRKLNKRTGPGTDAAVVIYIFPGGSVSSEHAVQAVNVRRLCMRECVYVDMPRTAPGRMQTSPSRRICRLHSTHTHTEREQNTDKYDVDRAVLMIATEQSIRLHHPIPSIHPK